MRAGHFKISSPIYLAAGAVWGDLENEQRRIEIYRIDNMAWPASMSPAGVAPSVGGRSMVGIGGPSIVKKANQAAFVELENNENIIMRRASMASICRAYYLASAASFKM